MLQQLLLSQLVWRTHREPHMGILGEKLCVWLWELACQRLRCGPVGRASQRCTGLYEAVPLHHPAAGDQLCLWGSISAPVTSSLCLWF